MFVLEGEDLILAAALWCLKKGLGDNTLLGRKYRLTLRSVCGGVVRGLKTNSAKKQAKHSGVFPQCNLDSGWVESRNWVPNSESKATEA